MNEYQKKYEDLINFRKNIQPFNRWNQLHAREREVNLPPAYGEYHHIQPRCLRPDLEEDPNNIVCLTAKEHLLAHQYLALWFSTEFGEDDSRTVAMVNAYEFSVRDKRHPEVPLTIDEAVKLKYLRLKVRSDRAKRCAKDPERIKRSTERLVAWNKSEDHKRRMGTPKARANISKAMKGVPLSKKNRDGITKTWRTEQKRKEQSERLKKKYREDPSYRQRVSENNVRRFSDPKEREVMSQKLVTYFELHPEARKKHSEDLKGRVYVNLPTGSFKMIKPAEVEIFLKNNPGSYLRETSKKSYEVWKKQNQSSVSNQLDD